VGGEVGALERIEPWCKAGLKAHKDVGKE